MHDAKIMHARANVKGISRYMVIGIYVPKLLVFSWYFYRYLENGLLKIWLNMGIYGSDKIGLVFGFCGCHFIGIGLVSVCHFAENDISRAQTILRQIPAVIKHVRTYVHRSATVSSYRQDNRYDVSAS